MSGEPTLRDVLEMLARMREDMATKGDLRGVRDEVAAHRAETRADSREIRADVAAHRAETAASFKALDAELSKHADPLHRELERRVAALEATATRPAAPRRTRARRG
jgi:hypothetical protein